ncbi:hypothetical protein D3C85_1621410 [compost metagenome]
MWQTVNIVGTEDHVHKAVLLHNPVHHRLLLRHTPAYAEQKTWLLKLQRLQMPKLAEHLVLSVLPDRTSIQQNQIGLFAILC